MTPETSGASADDEELVVLVSADGHATGTAPKATVHHADTPLHLAFSVYLFDDAGSLLVTRRALAKATFPGVWTNSACGHPAPGEPVEDAVGRRARDELGLDVHDLRLVLPRFSYRAEMDGVVEWELCPVLAGRVDGLAPRPAPDPTEVEAAEWVPWREFADDVRNGRREVSSWCREQVIELVDLGPEPVDWPTGDVIDLPAAMTTRLP
ncbi:isopentenyl-diphosphate Delta-isomerase [Terrabacter aerolatus]|uniref:Isopentenyl-diphosphate Delta-isomerase n=1 Tax=Terrabacter aerolatus TaxID=422442 RepID=A0A512D5A7_9MICO|nr:isopentenyl-diphosphate Delta-isomerase [Terrabacter aerolatus]GEO31638.1 isopentenyl-diphosphate Delta-isomerase [Terrabacter aerolatus]